MGARESWRTVAIARPASDNALHYHSAYCLRRQVINEPSFKASEIAIGNCIDPDLGCVHCVGD
jgi:hypothetical protein